MSQFTKVLKTLTEGLGNSEVNFDRENGMGSVPQQVDISYFGFTTEMSPAEFRSLVPKGNANRDTTDMLLGMDDPVIAPPFLSVEWLNDKKMWLVTDHEGRSRADYCAIKGVSVMPIDIIPNGGMRARDITDEMKNTPFIPQR